MDSKTKDTIQRFQAGDRDAFADLVSQFQNLVTATALAESGDFQRSEDIAQQSFMVAWEKQRELKDPNRFAGWLRGIARNLARNDRRLKANLHSRSNMEIDDSNEPAINTLTPMESHSREEQRETLWATVQCIPAEYREPMILFYREEKSVRIVAELLGLTDDAVKQRLRRGRGMLREEIRSMVEDLLFDTRPSPAFSAGVIAGLPAADTTVQSSVLLGAKAMFVKLFGAMGAGALLGVLGGLLGTFGGIFGAWVGMRGSIKHATSEDEKKVYRFAFVFLTVISIVYFVALVLVGQSFPVAVLLFSALFWCGLLGSMYWLTRRVRALHRIHGRPASMDLQKFDPQPKSRKELWMMTGGLMLCTSCWLPGYAIRKGSLGITVIALSIFAIHACWQWRKTEGTTDVWDQTRLIAQSMLEAGVIQTSILLLGWLTQANIALEPIEGLPVGTPFVVLVPLPFVMTLVFWLFQRVRIKDLQEDLAERDLAR